MPSWALTTVATKDLRTLLRAVFKEQVQCPLSPAALAMLGLQDTSPALLEHLRGLESEAVHAVLVAVLAERSLDDETRRRRELGLA
ncbi:MAG: hypothetical protein H6712_32915 [Myxococcales bacterium]|nr:hypothetical protein [Myxococcales bacterium]MCB9718695.1 hypothetical protein [Myxococcales bacterium]